MDRNQRQNEAYLRRTKEEQRNQRPKTTYQPKPQQKRDPYAMSDSERRANESYARRGETQRYTATQKAREAKMEQERTRRQLEEAFRYAPPSKEEQERLRKTNARSGAAQKAMANAMAKAGRKG